MRSRALAATGRDLQSVNEAFCCACRLARDEVAALLLERGADIDTRWSSHEPAGILRNLVFLPSPLDRMRFLVDRGIDLTIRDDRWNATAEGWARYALRDETVADWLAGAQRERKAKRLSVRRVCALIASS